MRQFPKCRVYCTEYAKEALASDKLNLSKYNGTPISYSGDNIEIVHEGEKKCLFEGLSPRNLHARLRRHVSRQPRDCVKSHERDKHRQA